MAFNINDSKHRLLMDKVEDMYKDKFSNIHNEYNIDGSFLSEEKKIGLYSNNIRYYNLPIKFFVGLLDHFMISYFFNEIVDLYNEEYKKLHELPHTENNMNINVCVATNKKRDIYFLFIKIDTNNLEKIISSTGGRIYHLKDGEYIIPLYRGNYIICRELMKYVGINTDIFTEDYIDIKIVSRIKKIYSHMTVKVTWNSNSTLHKNITFF